MQLGRVPGWWEVLQENDHNIEGRGAKLVFDWDRTSCKYTEAHRGGNIVQGYGCYNLNYSGCTSVDPQHSCAISQGQVNYAIAVSGPLASSPCDIQGESGFNTVRAAVFLSAKSATGLRNPFKVSAFKAVTVKERVPGALLRIAVAVARGGAAVTCKETDVGP